MTSCLLQKMKREKDSNSEMLFHNCIFYSIILKGRSDVFLQRH